MMRGINFFARDMDYSPANDNGRKFIFTGDADTNLKGKTITWTFPNMNGSATIPAYKSTSEQLVQGVPYVELVSSDGNITGINYRLVNAQTLAAVNPSYRTEMNLIVERKNSHPLESDWQDNNSGTWTLDEPVVSEDLDVVVVELRSYEDAANPAMYHWDFSPASDKPEEPASPDIKPESPDKSISQDLTARLGSSSGGCNAGFSMAGVVILILLRKR